MNDGLRFKNSKCNNSINKNKIKVQQQLSKQFFFFVKCHQQPFWHVIDVFINNYKWFICQQVIERPPFIT